MPDHRPTDGPARFSPAQFERFYAERTPKLRRVVAANVLNADVLDDACQYAWLQFIRRGDVGLDAAGFGWLVTVAIHESWRLVRTPKQVPSGPFRGCDDLALYELPEPAAVHGDPEGLAIRRALHADRLEDFKTLKPAERRDLFLQALGFSYREIAEITDSNYTAVNRHISEGRTKLQRAARRRKWREGANLGGDDL
jgi:DNA-directed RNA polymerase specialized sigma24 family protein